MKTWDLPPFNGYFNRPTWAIVTWLTNVEPWYFKAKWFVTLEMDAEKFQKNILDMIKTDSVAVSDINPSSRDDRWDHGLRQNVYWREVIDALKTI
jgi:hypothetical protein